MRGTMRGAAIVIVVVSGCSPLTLPIDTGAGTGSTSGASDGTGDGMMVPTTEPASTGASGAATGASAETGTSTGATSEAGASESTGAAVCVPATGAPAEVAFMQQGTGAGQQTIQAVVLDGAGDIFVAGDFQGALNFAGEGVDEVEGVAPFVARLDCAGQLRWRVTGTAVAGASGPAFALTLAGGDVYIGGPLVGEIGLPDGSTLDGGAAASFVARLDAADGSVIGSAVVADEAVDVHALVVGGDGGVIAAGACLKNGNQQGVLLAELSPDPFLVTQRCMYTPVPTDAKHRSVALTLALGPGGDVVVGGGLNGPLAELGAPVVMGEGDAFIARVSVPLEAAPANPFMAGWPLFFGGPTPHDRVNGIAVADGSQEIVMVGKGEGQFFAEPACQASSGIVTAFVTRLDASGACIAHEMMLTDPMQATEAHAVAIRGEHTYVLGQFFGVLGVGGEAIAETQSDHGIRMFMLALNPALEVQAQHFSGEDFVGADCNAQENEQARALGRAIAADDSLVAVVADACGTGINVAGAPLADTDTVLLGLFPLP